MLAGRVDAVDLSSAVGRPPPICRRRSLQLGGEEGRVLAGQDVGVDTSSAGGAASPDPPSPITVIGAVVVARRAG